jgi:tRNA modification GTPase
VRAVLRADRPRFEPTAARQLVRARLDDGRGEQPALLLWMRAPRSYTREDVAELHLPGAEPLLAAALARFVALGASVAAPGEFTRRAFLNGRIDLAGAEGVLALVEASSEAERVAAARLLEGGLEERLPAVRERLLELATLCEASLDFDERETGHVPHVELAGLWEAARRALLDALALERERAAPAALARVVLAGAPNAGKSTLWNRLTGGAALVSPVPGTTRDALEGRWTLGREECLLIDGPGLEAVDGGPGVRAQELFARARAQADLVLWVVDGSAPPSSPAAARPEGARLVVATKLDLAPAGTLGDLGGLPVLAVSARTGAGLPALARAVGRELEHAGEGAVRGLHARHRAGLEVALAALERGARELADEGPLDLVAEEVRAALAALEELSGRTTPEDVLDRIFARFCLGK